MGGLSIAIYDLWRVAMKVENSLGYELCEISWGQLRKVGIQSFWKMEKWGYKLTIMRIIMEYVAKNLLSFL